MHPPRFTNSISCSFMLTRLSGGAYSDTSIATLHDLLQIAFDWSDFHLHRFLIRGKAYGISRLGGCGFTTDARKVVLSQFRFRTNERFLYEYDFVDLWQHQIRFESVAPIEGKKSYPVCIAGACASPPEDCGGRRPIWTRWTTTAGIRPWMNSS